MSQAVSSVLARAAVLVALLLPTGSARHDGEAPARVPANGATPAAPLAAPDESAAPAPVASGVLAIIHATLVPMDSERHLPDHTVLVSEGVITALGPSADVAVPAGAQVIDGRGLFLAPGLHDMHVHLWGQDDLLLFLANGVTTVRNMWGAPFHAGLEAALAAGQGDGPRIISASPILDGVPPIWNGSTPVPDAETARATVDEIAAAGYRALKVYNRLSPEAYHALVTAAREHGLPVWGHVPDAVGLRAALAAGQDSIEHLTGFAEVLLPDDAPALDAGGPKRRWTLISEHDPDKLAALAVEVAATDTWNCPTLVVYTRFVSAETGRALLAAPEMAFVTPSTRATWNPDTDFRSQGLTDEDSTALREADAARQQVVGALHDAGARLLLGTDTPNPFVVPGYAIHDELQLLVASGLSPFEAAAAGTRDAALFLGDDDRRGTLAVGLDADLVLLASDPLAGVGAWREPRVVVSRGRALTRAELDSRLAAQAARFLSGPDTERWFDGLPPMPQADDLLAARFEVRFNDQLVGIERATYRNTGDDDYAMTVQVAFDPAWSLAFHIDLNATRGQASVAVQARLPEGPAGAQLKQLRDTLSVSGSGAWATTDGPLQFEDVLRLGLPSAPTSLPLWRELTSLGVGEERPLTRLDLEASAPLQLVPVRLTARRLPDETDDDGRTLIVVELHSRSNDGSLRSVIRMDLRDPLLVRSIEQYEQLGVIRAVRVE